MAKEIPLQNGMVAIVDDEDYGRVNQFNWTLGISGKNKILSSLCVHRKLNKSTINLSTFVLEVKLSKGEFIHHISGDKLNFKKSNLKVVKKNEYMKLSKGYKNTSSEYKGVSWNKRKEKWKAGTRAGGKQVFFGYFDDEDEAAKAYNAGVNKLFGDEVYQNIIGEDNSTEECSLENSVVHRSSKNKKSKYRGVKFHNKRNMWQIQVKKGKGHTTLGYFRTEVEAAKAYDKKAKEIYGDKAILNFPELVGAL